MHPDLAEYGPVHFHGDPNALYDRHLVFDYAIDPDLATPRERYEAVARSLRDVLALRWLRTKKTHYKLDPKRAYYLSMEFLIGRSLASNVSNLLLDPAMLEACRGEERRLVRAARPGARRRPGKRRPGPSGRLLHRIDGDYGIAGDGLRLALRVRHFQAGHSRRLAKRKAGQLAAASRSLGGGAARSHRRSEARVAPSRFAEACWFRCPESHRRCSEFPSTARSWAMAAAPSTPFACGPPARRILSISISSATAISSAR